MRIGTAATILALTFASTGCLKLLNGYYSAPKHFLWGTTKVEQSEKSVDRAYHAALEVLKERGYGVSRKELHSESAMIRANKGAAEWVVDIESRGEGSVIRVETDEGGQQAEVIQLQRWIAMMP
jgi:hypothetical protein